MSPSISAAPWITGLVQLTFLTQKDPGGSLLRSTSASTAMAAAAAAGVSGSEEKLIKVSTSAAPDALGSLVLQRN